MARDKEWDFIIIGIAVLIFMALIGGKIPNPFGNPESVFWIGYGMSNVPWTYSNGVFENNFNGAESWTKSFGEMNVYHVDYGYISSSSKHLLLEENIVRKVMVNCYGTEYTVDQFDYVASPLSDSFKIDSSGSGIYCVSKLKIYTNEQVTTTTTVNSGGVIPDPEIPFLSNAWFASFIQGIIDWFRSIHLFSVTSTNDYSVILGNTFNGNLVIVNNGTMVDTYKTGGYKSFFYKNYIITDSVGNIVKQGNVEDAVIGDNSFSISFTPTKADQFLIIMRIAEVDARWSGTEQVNDAPKEVNRLVKTVGVTEIPDAVKPTIDLTFFTNLINSIINWFSNLFH